MKMTVLQLQLEMQAKCFDIFLKNLENYVVTTLASKKYHKVTSKELTRVKSLTR